MCPRNAPALCDEHIYVPSDPIQYQLCIKEVRVNPYLLSSNITNKSRPQLSTYVYLKKGRKRAVLVRE